MGASANMDYNFLQGYLQSECVSPSPKNYAQICDISISRRQQQHLVSRSVELVFVGRVRQGLWVSPWLDEIGFFFGTEPPQENESLVRFFRLALGLRKQHRDLLERTTFMTCPDAVGIDVFSMISSNRVPFGRDFFVDWAISSEFYFLRCKVEVKAKCFCKIFQHNLVSRASWISATSEYSKLACHLGCRIICLRYISTFPSFWSCGNPWI